MKKTNDKENKRKSKVNWLMIFLIIGIIFSIAISVIPILLFFISPKIEVIQLLINLMKVNGVNEGSIWVAFFQLGTYFGSVLVAATGVIITYVFSQRVVKLTEYSAEIGRQAKEVSDRVFEEEKDERFMSSWFNNLTACEELDRNIEEIKLENNTEIDDFDSVIQLINKLYLKNKRAVKLFNIYKDKNISGKILFLLYKLQQTLINENKDIDHIKDFIDVIKNQDSRKTEIDKLRELIRQYELQKEIIQKQFENNEINDEEYKKEMQNQDFIINDEKESLENEYKLDFILESSGIDTIKEELLQKGKKIIKDRETFIEELLYSINEIKQSISTKFESIKI